jgi:DNA-binding PucR family transcriptional regulator
VLGPTVGWEDAHASIHRALLAWPIHAAGALGDDHLARTDDHLLTLLLAASPRLTDDLVTRRLAALEDMTPGARERAEATLRAWLDAHGDVSVAAEALHVHPQTVRYRLNGLREAFGDGVLDDPAARLELALALQAATALSRRVPGAGEDEASASVSSEGPPPGNA